MQYVRKCMLNKQACTCYSVSCIYKIYRYRASPWALGLRLRPIAPCPMSCFGPSKGFRAEATTWIFLGIYLHIFCQFYGFGTILFKIRWLGTRPHVGRLAVRVSTSLYRAQTNMETRKNHRGRERGDGGRERPAEMPAMATGGPGRTARPLGLHEWD